MIFIFGAKLNEEAKNTEPIKSLVGACFSREDKYFESFTVLSGINPLLPR